MAGQYETYKFKKLVFSYVSTCPTTTSGYVIIAIDYDPGDLAPSSKIAMMSYDGAVRSNAWSNVSNVSSHENLSKYHRYYCNYEANHTDSTGKSRTNDIGTLNVVAQGQQTVDVIGELYVEYEVDFFTPQLNTLASNGGSLMVAREGSTLNFYASAFHGNLNLAPYDSTSLMFRQGFQGVVILRQQGTGITAQPGIAISAGNPIYTRYGYIQVSGSNGVSAVHVYKLRANARSIMTPAIGTCTTMTNYYIELYPCSTETWNAL